MSPCPIDGDALDARTNLGGAIAYLVEESSGAPWRNLSGPVLEDGFVATFAAKLIGCTIRPTSLLWALSQHRYLNTRAVWPLRDRNGVDLAITLVAAPQLDPLFSQPMNGLACRQFIASKLWVVWATVPVDELRRLYPECLSQLPALVPSSSSVSPSAPSFSPPPPPPLFAGGRR